MLFSIDDKQIRSIPTKRMVEFRQWRSRLSTTDYQAAVEGIRSRLDGKEFVVSSFMPGHDWTGTEFAPLYTACNRNVEHAGWFFGLLVWETMIAHEDEWCFSPLEVKTMYRGCAIFGEKRNEPHGTGPTNAARSDADNPHGSANPDPVFVTDRVQPN